MTRRIRFQKVKNTSVPGGETARKNRADLEQQVRQDMKRVRQSIDPALLKRVRKLFDAPALPSGETVPIDRERNVQFIMDFLSSPQGAHLKDRILKP